MLTDPGGGVGGLSSLSFFGLGKLGLPMAALFASSGLSTLAIDIKETLVDRLRSGIFPDAEPGVRSLLARGRDRIEQAVIESGAHRVAVLGLSFKQGHPPIGVRARNSDNRLVRERLGWAPSEQPVKGLERTYAWVEEQVRRRGRPAMSGIKQPLELRP